MKKRMKLMLLVVAMAVIVGASMNPVSAATLILDETVEVSYDKSAVNISVYPGNASYSGSWETDILNSLLSNEISTSSSRVSVAALTGFMLAPTITAIATTNNINFIFFLISHTPSKKTKK